MSINSDLYISHRTQAGRRGRGNGRAYSFHRPSRSINEERPPSPPYGPVLRSFRERSLHAADECTDSNSELIQITDCKLIGSFNWVESDEPTILVPGMPPAWTPLSEPRKLKPDAGKYFKDPNAARFPNFPLEPSVRVFKAENGDTSPQDIDIFACSSTMGSLLRFVRRVDKPFRFFVQAIGNTVFFARHENTPTELILNVKGYGHSFPEAYTTWDKEVRGSLSHQRLLNYQLSGLNCIIRFECDGYIREKVPGGLAPSGNLDGHPISGSDVNFDSMLENLLVSSPFTGGKGYEALQLRALGQIVPQEAIFDLKTRSVRNKKFGNVKETELPRFWIAQIPTLIFARHDNGLFEDIEIDRVDVEAKKWEEENQRDIRRFRWLLHEIISTAKSRPDHKLEVCCKSLDAIELREQDNDEHDTLPADLQRWWMGDDSSEPDTNIEDDRHGQDGHAGSSLLNYQSESEESFKDFTACSVDLCGYCGHCPH